MLAPGLANMTARGPATCQACRDALNLALQNLGAAVRLAAAWPSAIRIARYNQTQAELQSALAVAWQCPRCLDLAAPGSEELPLFPDLAP